MAAVEYIIVKLRKKQSVEHGNHIAVYAEKVKDPIYFPFTDVNYGVLEKLMGNRIMMFAHATKKAGVLEIVGEAPYQSW